MSSRLYAPPQFEYFLIPSPLQKLKTAGLFWLSRRQNSHLEKQIRVLEGAKQSGNYSSAADILEENGLNDDASTLVAPRNDYVVADDTAAAAEIAEASGGGGGGGVSRVIAPGQSLLLTTSAAPHIQIAEQPPRKKMKP